MTREEENQEKTAALDIEILQNELSSRIDAFLKSREFRSPAPDPDSHHDCKGCCTH
ncbi:MAG: hypothetical protein ACSNEK_02920 [Parachlamydiaceae bacterium]